MWLKSNNPGGVLEGKKEIAAKMLGGEKATQESM